MAVPFCEIPDLEGLLRDLLRQVPRGRVTTYGRLADALGNRIAARWVGHFALHHDHSADCPCHRTVRADGRLGQYIDGDERAKARRLAEDGVSTKCSTVELARYLFDDFVSDRPLQRLRAIQDALRAKVSIRPRRRIPKLVGGVDVSYPRAGHGTAAFTLVETESGRLVWSTTVQRRVAFPYISTYLTFRELPILLELIDKVRTAGRLPEVLLVDGSGILHPRHAGIAAHLGVVASLPTVGVTKKLLCGQVEIEGMQPSESRPVVYEDRLLGMALRPTSGSRRPIFISPGHRVDLMFSERLVRSVLTGRRLPEPLYWADRLSRQAS
ncbi:MAG: endonuclease V [Thermoguttaceae bacterium]